MKVSSEVLELKQKQRGPEIPIQGPKDLFVLPLAYFVRLTLQPSHETRY